MSISSFTSLLLALRDIQSFSFERHWYKLMLDKILLALSNTESFLWSYIGIYFVLLFGLYLTIKSRFLQFRVLSKVKHTLVELHALSKKTTKDGVHPFKLYFASIGGTVGLGNMVSIATAVTIGGPGAIVWMWLAAFAGMLIKYCDIYLGIKYRVRDAKTGYDGGLLYYLQAAYRGRMIPIIAALLLCFYGIELFQFKVVTEQISTAFKFNQELVLCVLVGVILYTGIGGIKRLAGICTFMMPIFMVIYTSMCLWIIGLNYDMLGGVFFDIFKYSIQPHAAIGGFVGAAVSASMHHGIARAVYSGDIGIGYDSVVFSETKTNHPALQGSLVMIGSLVDVISSTLTLLVLLVTNVWRDPAITELSGYIIAALSMHFPYVNYIVVFLFFFAGYPVILGYFTVGMKCANYISKAFGRKIYIAYAILAFGSTLYVDQSNLMMLMSLGAVMLVMINIIAMWILRKEIKFG